MSNRRSTAALLAALLFAPACFAAGSQEPEEAATQTESTEAAGPESDDEETLYALGMLLSRNLAPFGLSADEVAQVQAGMRDALLGEKTRDIEDPNSFQERIRSLGQKRVEAAATEERTAAASFLAEEAAKTGAETTSSGLIYTVIEEGDGASPSSTARVTVHYHGTLRDGSVFDSSKDRGQPATFGLNQVIACWTEGVAKMKVGGKSKLVCPSNIAYGDQGRPPTIPGGAPLVFEVELLSIADDPTE